MKDIIKRCIEQYTKSTKRPPTYVLLSSQNTHDISDVDIIELKSLYGVTVEFKPDFRKNDIVVGEKKQNNQI